MGGSIGIGGSGKSASIVWTTTFAIFRRKEARMTPAARFMKTGDQELTISRILVSPPALVFKIWTQPLHMRRWWGPRGYTTLSCEVDLRPGGSWRVESRHVGGSATAEYGVFREIVEP